MGDERRALGFQPRLRPPQAPAYRPVEPSSSSSERGASLGAEQLRGEGFLEITSGADGIRNKWGPEKPKLSSFQARAGPAVKTVP